jgi:hypothetical protein
MYIISKNKCYLHSLRNKPGSKAGTNKFDIL